MMHVPAHKNVNCPAGQVHGVYPMRALPKPAIISVENTYNGASKAAARAFMSYYRRQFP